MGTEMSDCGTNNNFKNVNNTTRTNTEHNKGEKPELKQNEEYKSTKQPPTIRHLRTRTVWITEQYPDTQFTTHYTKLKQIGKPGSFGTAFRCQRKSDGKIFAVKEISKAKIYRLDPSHKVRKKMLTRMEAEIDIMRRLKHKYIVNMYETYESKHDLHIVMEECTGGELFARTKEKKSGYHEMDTKRVIRMICEALFYMHAKHRVVHGDIKPENILFINADEDSDIQIIDFGMSKICQPLKSLHTLCGTPYYIAPEVITGDYCHAADMWSVGVIAFVMIFGFPPFNVPPGTYYGVNEAKEIYKNVLKGFNPTVKRGYGAWFPKSLSNKLSTSGMHFIGNLLETDVTKRLSAKEALQHPWLKGEMLSMKTKMDLETLEMHQFASFAVSHKFKYAIASLFREQYKHMRPEHFKNLNNLFIELDTDKNGKISYAEFKHGILSKCHDFKLDVDKISEMFSELDINKEGEIEFRNLLDAAVHDFIIASDARLYKAFRDLDDNDDGKISTDILKQKICELNPYGSHNIDIILQIIDDVDLDNNGAIDYEEFLKVLHPDFNDTPNWFWSEKNDKNEDTFILHSSSTHGDNINENINVVHGFDDCKEMNKNVVAKQGYMKKEGKIIKSWKKRWFVLLNNGVMSYYEKKNDQEAISRFDVKQLTRLMYKSWSKTDKKRFGIKIHTPRRNWKFVCQNSEERCEWMRAIQTVAGYKISQAKIN